MTPRPFRVVRRRRETRDTWTLELEPVAGEPLDVAPGQFKMLYAFGVGEVPISVSRPQPAAARAHRPRRRRGEQAICAAAARRGARRARAVRQRLAARRGRGRRRRDRRRRDRPRAAARRRLRGARPARASSARSPCSTAPHAGRPAVRRRARALRGRVELEVDVTVDSAEPTGAARSASCPKLVAERALRPDVGDVRSSAGPRS